MLSVGSSGPPIAAGGTSPGKAEFHHPTGAPLSLSPIAASFLPLDPTQHFGLCRLGRGKPSPHLAAAATDPSPATRKGNAAKQIHSDLQPVEPRHVPSRIT